jgi:hypothetical protein
MSVSPAVEAPKEHKPKAYAGFCEPLEKVIGLAPERFASITGPLESVGWSTPVRLPDMARCQVRDALGKRYFTCTNPLTEHEEHALQEQAALAVVIRDCLKSEWREVTTSTRKKKVFRVPGGATVEVVLSPPSSRILAEWRLTLEVNEPQSRN